MSERGVFAVDRGIWADPDFPSEPFTEREAFMWLVGEAAWKDVTIRLGTRVIALVRGQCAFSTRFMAEKFQWSEAKVRRFLKRREDKGQITSEIDAGVTRVTVCKYDVFQRVGASSDAGATQERRRSDAKKKHDNTTSNEVGEGVAPAKRASRIGDYEPDVAMAVEMGMAPERARVQADTFKDFWKAKAGQAGVKLDWPATWRNWVRRKLEDQPSTGLRVVHTNRDPPRKSGSQLMTESGEDLLDELRNPDAQFWNQGRTVDGYAHRR